MLLSAQDLGDCENEARAWLAIGTIQDRQGEHAKALNSANNALALAEDNDCEIEAAEAVLLKAQSHYRLGDVESAEPITNEALALSRDAEDSFTTARCYSQLGLIHDDLGNFQDAWEYKQKALEVMEEIKGGWAREWVGTITLNLANTANLRGDYLDAIALYRKSLAVYRETKNQDMIIACLANMAAAKAGLGEFAEAEEDFREVLKITEKIEWLGKSLTNYHLAETCLSQDKTEKARQAALNALEFAKETGAQQALGAAWRALGKVAATTGDGLVIEDQELQAGDCFQKSDAIFSSLHADAERAQTLKAWGDYLLAAGDKKQGTRIREDAQGIFLRLGMVAEVEKMEKKTKLK